MNTEIQQMVSQLSTEEKISLTSGEGNWNTREVKGKDIPVVRMQDGPHGLRLQEGNGNDINGGGEPTVCFPAACLSAASFDRKLLNEMGKELGKECQAKQVHLLLGPGINIKRNPLCGRNFEYYSEDPLLAGELGAAFVAGVQEQGVGTCLKHFFANNQEFRRMSSSSNLDERTARELYLSAFERVIKKAQPWSVMAAYNKVNDTYCTQNKEVLTDLLRKEFEFEGTVISDWGAVHEREKAISAGCDLTMPGEDNDDAVREALEEGKLSEEELDRAAGNVIRLGMKAMQGQKDGIKFDYEAGHALAEKIAEESIVLLKNEDRILPLNPEEQILYLGDFAKHPRYQGSGSSRISSRQVDNAIDAACKLIPETNISFSKGYDSDEVNETMIAQAVEAAKEAQKVVIFAGLSNEMESEGFDRKNMSLPQSHNELIERVLAVQPNTIVVLHNGAPVELPWINHVKGLVETYLGGEAIGSAITRILFGKVNPSGRLPESFPIKVEDNPSYLFYGGENGKVDYSERMFVGYRYYCSIGREVQFPFGYGLSYTSFEYSNLNLSTDWMEEGKSVKVSIDIKNTGNEAGKEVVQLYIIPPAGEYKRPVKELKGFEKVSLAACETKTVEFELSYRDFACYSPEAGKWYACPGKYQIAIGYDAVHMAEVSEIQIKGRELIMTEHFDESTMIKEFVLHPIGEKFFLEHFEGMMRGMSAAGLIPAKMIEPVIAAGPEKGMEGLLDQTVSLMLDFNGISLEERQSLFAAMNQ